MNNIDISELELNVFLNLEKYIYLHNSIFKKKRNLFHIIKDLFIPIDFNEIKIQSLEILYSLNATKTILNSSFNSNNNLNLRDEFKNYTEKLIIAVTKFTSILSRLIDKSSGKPYKINEYLFDFNEYKMTIEEYSRNGQVINSLMNSKLDFSRNK
jgi:hypothetical protein